MPGPREGADTETVDVVAELLELTSDGPVATGPVLERAAALIARRVGADGVAVIMRDPLTGRLRRAATWGQTPEIADEFEALGPIGAAFTVPLRYSGEAIGAIGCFGVSDVPGVLEPDIDKAARILAMIIRSARYERGLRDRAAELSDQSRLAREVQTLQAALVTFTNLTETDQCIVEAARRALAGRRVELWQGSGGGRVLLARSAPGDDDRPARSSIAAIEKLEELQDGCFAATLDGESSVQIVIEPTDGQAARPEMIAEFSAHAAGVRNQAIVAIALTEEQKARRAVGAALIEAQDAERQRIAEAVHDGPVQEMVGMALSLDALAADLRHGERIEDAERSAQAARNARDAVRLLREAIFDLHPLSAQELGVATIARTLARKLKSAGHHLKRLEISDNIDDLPTPIQSTAVKVLNESVANIIRHSKADSVEIDINATDGWLHIHVVDDGLGFDPPDLSERLREGHLGLLAMRQRVDLIGGEMAVNSSPGHGTELVVRLPLNGSVDD